MIVELSRRAQRQMRAAEHWWLANRDKAPEAFDEEILRVRELLSHTPYAGVPWRTESGRLLRRLTLERIRYFMFYRVQPKSVVIVALWHASRRPPRV